MLIFSDAAECKLLWKVIRGGFTRYLKSKNTTGSGAKKPYYLWNTLQLLLPFTKSRAQSGKFSATLPSAPQVIVEIIEKKQEGMNDQEDNTKDDLYRL